MSNARSDVIGLGTPSSSIVILSVMDARMPFGPSLHGNTFEYKSVTIQSKAVEANGGWSA